MKKLITIILLAICLKSNASFRQTIEVKYQKEYDCLLKNPEWSKQDTDDLMEMCKEYNLRFYIIYLALLSSLVGFRFYYKLPNNKDKFIL